jgi:hypothetical protein
MEAKGSWLEPEGHETEGGAAADKAEKINMATTARTAELKRHFSLIEIPPAIIADETKAILTFLETKEKGESGSGLPGRRPAYFQPMLSRASSP